MRTVWLVLLVAVGAWAQSTGGTFGSGGLSGGGSSRTGGNSSTGGGARTGGSSSTGSSLFNDDRRDRPRQPRAELSPEEKAAREEATRRWQEAQRQKEIAFAASHRLAGTPEDISKDPRVRGPATTYLVGWRLPHLLIGLGLFALIAGVQLLRERGKERAWSPDPETLARRAAAITPKVDTRAARGFVLSLGFDWTAREQLQAELQRLSQLPMGDDLERLMVLFELVKAAKAHAKAVRYAKVRDVAGNVTTVEDALYAAQKELRARYTHESVGAARQLPAVQARPLEGPGLLVLSIIVGSRAAEIPLGDWMPLDGLLDRVGQFTPSPQLLYVVWSPAVDGDRLSSAELEVLYPELELVGPARLGRVACGRCNAVYALELERCPSCGAQEDRSAGKTPAPPCPWCGHATPPHETKCGHCGAFVEGAPVPRA